MNQERYQLMLSLATEGFWDIDLETGRAYLSPRCCELIGSSPEDSACDASSFPSLLHPDDRERVVASIGEHLREARTGIYTFECRIISRDGTVRWVEGRGRVVAWDGRGAPLRLAGTISDISDRKNADHEEELLRLSERKYSTVFHTSPDAVILTRKVDGKYLEINSGFTAISGYAIEEAIGKSSLELNLWTDPADRERLTREIDEHGIVRGMESRFRRKDGSTMIGEISACSLEINGEPCLLSIVRDITLQNQAFQALHDSEEHLRHILDAIPVCMAVTDGTDIEYVNSTFVRNFGYALKEIATTQEWFQRAYPDPIYRDTLVPAWISALKEARTSGIPVPTMEALVTCKDGTVRHTLANTEIIQDRILVIFTDITERETLQKERLKNLKLESLGVLAGGIAHDFNNILTGVMGHISFAKMLLEKAQDATETLNRAEKASIRAADLARRLLVFAKGGHPIKKIVHLEKAVDEAISLVLSGSNVKGIIDIPLRLHAVEADEGQIIQCFHNIIINAVQAMPGGGKLTIRGANIPLKQGNSFGLPAGTYVSISFTDVGSGISEEDQKKVFDPYFTTKAGGSGLGLASAYAIIARHGGHISVSSTMGDGTTFSIYLPSMGESGSPQDAEQVPATVDHAGGAILVMDDEEAVRDLACLTLGHAGYAVTTCESGTEAIALYKAAKQEGRPFMVTIMDLTIPGGMGGVEAARCILDFDPEAVLVVSSGYSADPVMADCEKYGFRTAIKKPYTVDEILEAIKNIR